MQVRGHGVSHVVNIMTKEGLAPVTLTAPYGFRFESILSDFEPSHTCAKILLRLEKIK
jgi:hypothetical protein